MSWSSQQEAIRLAFASALGLPDRTGADGSTTVQEVSWVGTSSAGMQWATNGVQATLELTQVRNMDDDEVREAYDEDLDALVQAYGGRRNITVRLKITSDSQDPGQAAPGELAGKARTRLRRGTTIETLNDEGVSLVKIHPTMEVDRIDVNGRLQSAAVVDFVFGTVEWWLDTENGDYFEGVSGSGDLTYPDGTVVEDAVPFDTR